MSVAYYSAFGLTLASPIAFPELDVIAEPADVDVELLVRSGSAPAAGSHGVAATDPLHVVEIADSAIGLRVSAGSRIEVTEADPANRAFTRAVVLGPGFATVLYQRGAWPVHVGAVSGRMGAWLLGGDSGAGKSTLVTWLHARRSIRALCDDIGVVSTTDGGLCFTPGPRQIRLLPDAYTCVFATPSSEVPDKEGKIRVRLPALSAPLSASVRGLVVLAISDRESAPSVRRLHGLEAFEAIRSAIYRPWIGLSIRNAADTSRFCSAFLAAAPVYRYTRPRDLARFAEVITPLENLLLT